MHSQEAAGAWAAMGFVTCPCPVSWLPPSGRNVTCLFLSPSCLPLQVLPAPWARLNQDEGLLLRRSRWAAFGSVLGKVASESLSFLIANVVPSGGRLRGFRQRGAEGLEPSPAWFRQAANVACWWWWWAFPSGVLWEVPLLPSYSCWGQCGSGPPGSGRRSGLPASEVGLPRTHCWDQWWQSLISWPWQRLWKLLLGVGKYPQIKVIGRAGGLAIGWMRPTKR